MLFMPNWLLSEFYLTQGRFLSYLRKHRSAESCFQRAAEADSANLAAWIWLGWARVQQQNYERAIPCFDHAISLNPDQGYAHYQRGNCLVRSDKIREGIEEIERARRMSKKLEADPDLLLVLGHALFRLDDFQRALVAYKSILRYRPKDREVLLNMGLLLDHTGDYEQAEQTFKALLDVDPENDQAHYELGFALGAQCKWEASLSELAKIRVPNSRAYCVIGFAHRELSRNEEALAAFQKSVALDPTNYDALQRLSVLYGDLGEWEKSLETARQLIHLRPEEEPGYWGESSALAQLGRFDEAIETLEAALRLNPISVPALGGLAYIYNNKGQYEEAITNARAALQHDSDNLPAIECLSYALAAKSQFNEAISVLEAALLKHPDAHRLRVSLASAYLDSGKRGPAEEQREILRNVAPDLAAEIDQQFGIN